jgi:tetratricopeptide (TPR) repeat protein
VVQVLLDAAGLAVMSGAPAEAAALGSRALEEPPPRELRPVVMQLLGLAQLLAGEPEKGLARLRQALELTQDQGARDALVDQVSLALLQLGRAEEAVDVAEAELESSAGVERPDPLALHVTLG